MSNRDTKVEEIYKNLSKQDKDGILSFLQCSLFNNSEIVISFHLYLSENISHGKDLDKRDLYQSAFKKDEKFSDLKVRVFLTKLVKLVEKYLIVKSLDAYPLAELNLLNDYYRKNHLHKNYTVFFNSKTDFDFDSYEEYLLYNYAYSTRRLDFIYQEHAHDAERVRKHFEDVSSAQQKLSFFQTLKTQCDFLSFTQKFRTEKDNTYIEGVINHLIDTREEQDVVFRAYILVFLLSTKDNSENLFLELKSIVMGKEIHYEMNFRALLTHLQNFCIRFVNQGKTHYLEHLFDIYKLSMTLYRVVGDLTPVSFRNIVYVALQLNQIKWAEEFVENYQGLVNQSEQENNYNFNYARIYFEKGDYRSAMRQLIRVNYEHPFYASIGRILLIKCYYELNDELPLLSCCSSLTQFLNRNKEFTKQRIENNLHFIKYVKNLQKNRLKNNKSYFQKMEEKIKDSTVVEKEWLLKKLKAFSY